MKIFIKAKIMHRIVLILVLTIQSLLVCAQTYIPFPQDSVSWNVTTFIYGDCVPTVENNCQYTDKFILMGDTVMKNLSYSKLFLIEGNSIDQRTFIGGLREDSSKKVFFMGNLEQIFYRIQLCHDQLVNDTLELLLYDFGIDLTDTVQNQLYNCKMETVYEIDSIEYAGKMRKRYLMQRYGLNDNYWIEGVGSTKGLFYPLLKPDEWDWELSCFEDHVSDWSASECVTTGKHHISTSISSIRIYPNPFTDNIHLDLPSSTAMPLDIEIFDAYGRLVLNSVLDKPTSIVDLSSFPDGLYFLSVKNKRDIITRVIYKNSL